MILIPVRLKVNKIMEYPSKQAKNYYTAILGTGSVGTVLAFCLSKISECMQFDSKGLITTDRKHTLVNRENIKFSIETPCFDFSKLDAVFICTKIYHIQDVINQYINKIKTDIPIVLVCNGFILDILDKLIESYPSHKFRISYTDFGVSKLENCIYKLNSVSSSFIWGEYCGPSSTEFQISQLFPFEKVLSNYKDEFTNTSFIYSDSCIKYNYIKWIFNTCLNSMCVYRNCSTNSKVLDYQDELKQVFDETFKLSKLIFKKFQTETDPSALFQKLLSLIERTALNPNSMVSDILSKRLTENEYLAGLSQRDPQSFPLLSKIYSFIKDIDEKLK